MVFVKQKGTKATKNLSADFTSIQQEFVVKVKKVIEDHSVPDALIINWDQTTC